MSADPCGAARAWLSAFRDGEALPDPAAREHLDACTRCAPWEATVDVLTRRLVVRPATTPRTDLAARALAVWNAAGPPLPRQLRIGRVMLAIAGAAGIVLALVSLTAVSGPAAHFLRDLVAMEAALAVGFLLSAWRPDRYPRSLVPVAGVAGALTLVASAPVLGSGAAALVAEASHLTLLLGLFGLFVLLDATGTTSPRRRRIA